MGKLLKTKKILNMIKLFFFLILCIFLTTSSYALLINDTQLFVYLPFDNNLTDLSISNGGNDFSGSVSYNATSKVYGTHSLHMGSNNAVNTVNSSIMVNTNNFTVTLWFSTQDTGSTSTYLYWHGDADPYFSVRKNTADIRILSSGTDSVITTGGYADNNFYMSVVYRNTSTFGIKIYDTSCNLLETVEDADADSDDFNDVTELNIGSDKDLNYDWIGELDEFRLFHRVLLDDELQYICNNSEIPTGAGVTPSLTLDSSLVNNLNLSQDNIPYLFYFNGTSINNTNIYNCSVYLNNTLNNTKNNLNLSNNQNFSIQFYETNNFYTINLTCINENATDEIIVTNIFIDTVLPSITIHHFNSTNIYYSNVDYNLNITLEDENLFSYELDIFLNVSNTLYKRFSLSQNNLNTSFFNLTNSTNSSQWCTSPPCQMYLNITAYDSHTIFNIPNYKWKKVTFLGPNNITYKGITFNNNKLNLSTNDQNMINSWNLTKSFDRFKLELDFKESELNKNFDLFIQTNKKIYYLPNSKYLGHFVIDNLHWLDFETTSFISNFEITYYENLGYRVRFKPQESRIIFNSIGNLNQKSLNTSFLIIEEPSGDTIYLIQIDSDLNETKQYTQTISEGISMLGFVFLWLGLWIFGYILFQNSNEIIGIIMILLTIPIDFWFNYYFRQVLNIAAAWLGIAFYFMIGLTLAIILLMKRPIKKKFNSPFT